MTTNNSAVPWPRSDYEGVGGWNDGRLGQVYDLLAAVLKDRREKTHRHPLLTQIEEMDAAPAQGGDHAMQQGKEG